MTKIHIIPQRKKQFFLLILGFLLISIFSCKKETTDTTSHDPNKLPPLTHEGKNTFGCLVNGEIWVAYAPSSVGGAMAITGEFDSGSGHIEATLKTDTKHEAVKLFFKDVDSIGLYNFYLVSDTKTGIAYFLNPPNCSIYYHDTSNVGTMNITYFNNSNRIMSGTFQMDLVNPSCQGDTVRIREGRFDWRF